MPTIMPSPTPGTLKARLAAGETLVGSLITIGSAEVAEVMSLAGFDYLWIDLEHGAIDLVVAQRLIQAAGPRCPCLVRIPENREVWIKKALDLGCAGVVVPQIRSADEARQAVAACLYPPAGQRSVGITRAQGYGLSFAEYIASANDDLLVVVQAEHRDAVADIESIVRIPGVGCVLVGPFDLSGSMGLLGQVTHPQVQAAIERVRLACAHAGLPSGIFAVDAESARARAASGFRLIAVTMDAALLLDAARTTLARVRHAAGSEHA